MAGLSGKPGLVPYGFVVRVMGEIKEGGVDDLSLVVEPEARGGS